MIRSNGEDRFLFFQSQTRRGKLRFEVFQRMRWQLFEPYFFFFFFSIRDNYRDPLISRGIELFLMGERYGSPITTRGEASSHRPYCSNSSNFSHTRASYHSFLLIDQPRKNFFPRKETSQDRIVFVSTIGKLFERKTIYSALF